MVPDTPDNKWLVHYLDNLEKDIRDIKSCLSSLKNSLDEKYLTKNEFKASFTPVKLLVYGVVATIMGWVLSRLNMVLR